MYIFDYFFTVDEHYPGMKLPHPSGLLARQISTRAIILLANYQVNNVLSLTATSQSNANLSLKARERELVKDPTTNLVPT